MDVSVQVNGSIKSANKNGKQKCRNETKTSKTKSERRKNHNKKTNSPKKKKKIIKKKHTNRR